MTSLLAISRLCQLNHDLECGFQICDHVRGMRTPHVHALGQSTQAFFTN